MSILGYVSLLAAIAATSLRAGVEYDARDFLSSTERTSFNRRYPDFGNSAEKQWEWRDVDPLGLFTPAENRERRRLQFLLEYSPLEMPPDPPSPEQEALRTVLATDVVLCSASLSRSILKLRCPYAPEYEAPKLPVRDLLERTARIGLQWTQAGGDTVLIYNGPILLSRYRSGYVSLAKLGIDDPPLRNRATPSK